jgi:dTDP-4-amino-4,6-dideoxy-D-galactose acyltransferase
MSKVSLDLNVKYEHLSWDSEFLGTSVGKIIINKYKPELLNSLIEKNKDQLIYIFDNTFKPELEEFLQKFEVVNCGCRVEFKKELGEKVITTKYPEVDFYSGPINSELEELAYSCGKYSRFAFDDKLHKFFKPMYKRWIMNSLDGEKCLLIIEKNKKIIAFLSFSLHEKNAKIELFSVNRKNTGEGLGSRLYQTLEKFLTNRGIEKVVVAAQKENDGACRFYKRCGFKLFQEQRIFHLWRN